MSKPSEPSASAAQHLIELIKMRREAVAAGDRFAVRLIDERLHKIKCPEGRTR